MFKDYYINYYFLFLSINRTFPQKFGGHYAQCSLSSLLGWKLSHSVVTVFHLHQRVSNKVLHTGNQQQLYKGPVSCLLGQKLSGFDLLWN